VPDGRADRGAGLLDAMALSGRCPYSGPLSGPDGPLLTLLIGGAYLSRVGDDVMPSTVGAVPAVPSPVVVAMTR
jgi:hypothetical protein